MPSSLLAINALKVAVSQVGKQEDPKGSNWGHPVRDYLASVGISFPASWCMAFVYWCFDQASQASYTGNPLTRTGGVLHAWDLGGSHRLLINPMPGDIAIFDHGHGLGHTGIVESSDDINIHTIEGNTNDTGSREGFEVIRKIRRRDTVKGYLRY